jgi:hypothetical protein
METAARVMVGAAVGPLEAAWGRVSAPAAMQPDSRSNVNKRIVIFFMAWISVSLCQK